MADANDSDTASSSSDEAKDPSIDDQWVQEQLTEVSRAAARRAVQALANLAEVPLGRAIERSLVMSQKLWRLLERSTEK